LRHEDLNGGLDEAAVCLLSGRQIERSLFGLWPHEVPMAAPAAELKVARQILGWDPLTMARALRLGGTPNKLEARMAEMKAGNRDISRPVQVAMEAFLSGWRLTGWSEPVIG